MLSALNELTHFILMMTPWNRGWKPLFTDEEGSSRLDSRVPPWSEHFHLSLFTGGPKVTSLCLILTPHASRSLSFPRILRSTRSACLKEPTSRAIRWRFRRMTCPVSGSMASVTVWAVWGSPVERKHAPARPSAPASSTDRLRGCPLTGYIVKCLRRPRPLPNSPTATG